MKIIRIIILTLSLISISVELTGCATAGKNTIPQTGDMTMADIYKQETGLTPDSNSGTSNYEEMSKIRAKVNFQPSYIATGRTQTKNLFKPLPNPEIPIYVYPHLVQQDDGAPVPGYTTAFFLYQKNHFAMPSEVY
jgi:conjugative transfer region lipoprotein (TIGR03751 family)